MKIGLGVNIHSRNKGFIPERDMRGLFCAFNANRAGVLFEDDARTNPATDIGNATASWVSLNSGTGKMLVQTSAGLRPTVQAFNTSFKCLRFDAVDDLLRGEATMGAMLQNVSACTIYYVASYPAVSSGFQRYFYASTNGAGSTRFSTTMVNNAQDDFGLNIRRVDGGGIYQPLPTFGYIAGPQIRVDQVNFSNGNVQMFTYDELFSSALDGTASWGSDGSTSNTASASIELGAPLAGFGIDIAAIYVAQAYHTQAEITQSVDCFRAEFNL